MVTFRGTTVARPSTSGTLVAPTATGAASAHGPAMAGNGRFYGDPGAGNLYVGSHEPTPDWPTGQTTIATRYAESTYGPLAMVRRFYQDSGSYTGMASEVADDKAAGRIPWVSFKPGSTFYSRTPTQLSARYDLMLEFLTILDTADTMCLASVFHEPENDTTSLTQSELAADWLELQTQWAAARDEVGASKVVTASILMSYTYRTIGTRPWDEWTAAGAPCDIQGIDYYAYATNPTANQVLLSTPFYDVMNGTDSRPIAFAELGQTRSIGTTQWQAAMNEFYNYCATDSRIFGACYFDSGYNSVEPWPLTSPGEREYYNGTLRTKSYAVTRADVLGG